MMPNDRNIVNTAGPAEELPNSDTHASECVKYKVTQIRSTTNIEKRERVVYLVPDITPDDVDLDRWFDGTDMEYEDKGKEPCVISTEWEVLRHPNQSSTVRIEEDIKKNVLKGFCATREELILLGLHYLKICYEMEMPSGYGWDRSDRWQYYYSSVRYQQIADFIAKTDGIPSFQFWCHIYAYEKQADKLRTVDGFSSYWESREARLVREEEFSGYLEEVGWYDVDGNWNDYLGTPDAKVVECREQLKTDAIARWEKRKETARKIRETEGHRGLRSESGLLKHEESE